MESQPVSPVTSEVSYYVLGGDVSPYLLARICWPDVAQAITAGCRDWLDDPGLFDLPYDPISASVSVVRAAEIAAGWGSGLPTETTPTREFIRRMPAVWSNLTPAELRAWSLDFAVRRQADVGGAIAQNGTGPANDGTQRGLWRSAQQMFRRARPQVAAAASSDASEDPQPTAPVELSPVFGQVGAAVVVAEEVDPLVSGAERRRHARVPVEGWAQIRSGRDTVSADIVDFSEGGVHWVVLDTNAAFQVGERLNPPFVLEGDDSGEPFNLEVGGTVVWHSETRLGRHFGVAFEALSDEQAERVQHLLVTSGAERD